MADPIVVVTLITSGCALAGVVLGAIVNYRGKKVEVTGENDANLSQGQRDFIKILQQENGAWRVEVAKLNREIERLHREIAGLREELVVERHAREEATARLQAEASTRAQLSASRSADRADAAGGVVLDRQDADTEAAVHQAGEKAAKQTRDDQEGQ